MKRSPAKPLQDPLIEAPYISDKGAQRNIVGGVRWLSLQRAKVLSMDQNNNRGTSLCPPRSPSPLLLTSLLLHCEHVVPTRSPLNLWSLRLCTCRSRSSGGISIEVRSLSRARGANIGPLRNPSRLLLHTQAGHGCEEGLPPWAQHADDSYFPLRLSMGHDEWYAQQGVCSAR